MTVTSALTEMDWPALGIGNLIRKHIRSGTPIVAAAYFDVLPSEGDLKWAIRDLLDREINPAVAQHGGFVELIDVKRNNVYLRLGGGCQGCGAADVTLKQGIEKAIREPGSAVGEILDTTDHAAGRNPYYAPASDGGRPQRGSGTRAARAPRAAPPRRRPASRRARTGTRDSAVALRQRDEPLSPRAPRS